MKKILLNAKGKRISTFKSNLLADIYYKDSEGGIRKVDLEILTRNDTDEVTLIVGKLADARIVTLVGDPASKLSPIR